MPPEKHRAAADIFMEQNRQRNLPVDAPAQQAASVAPGVPSPSPALAMRASAPATFGAPPPPNPQGPKTSEELQLEKEPIRVRETGLWLFKRVVVPPNAYVVHTRMGRKTPVTIGLGLSFRYNPDTDAYLIVPAAMQTIGIVANGISKEKQGINILAYVQWQIADFAVAYRKLDFSDSRDPLGIVNAQLREQAEAAIKDKIATLSVEEILTDKQPIIEELTTRLKSVAEGRQGEQSDSEGLGIKIVTVQIKEAYVSSQTLWENLQAPFRYEKEQAARISHLLLQDEIRKKELENRRFAETGEAEAQVEIERIQQTKQTEAFELRVQEEQTRLTREQQALREKVQIEEQTTILQRESAQKLAEQKARLEQQARLAVLGRKQEEALEQARLASDEAVRRKVLEVEQTLREIEEQTRLAQAELEATRRQIERDTEKARLEGELNQLVQGREDALKQQQLEAEVNRRRLDRLAVLELQEAADRMEIALQERKAQIERLHQEIRNLSNERDLFGRLVAQLPEIASNMPEIHELKVLQTAPDSDGSFDGLSNFIARMLAIAESFGVKLGTNASTNGNSDGEEENR